MAETEPSRLPDTGLDARSSGIDVRTDIDYREAAQIIARSFEYIRFFTWRYIGKFVLKLGSYALPLALIPWPVKILTDHVILGIPIEEATDYPTYVWPLINALHGSST